MSWQATAWGQRQTTGSSGRKALLLVLANYADDQGICWPSQENRVAARLGGEGWEILQGTSDTELHRLTSLEERGKLDETMLEAIRFKYRQRGI
jgi:hypothetical protein